jgi:hypothetical protein
MLQGDHGQNFRNLIAHGLMNDERLNTAIGLYIWWLILRMTLLFSPEFMSYFRTELGVAAGGTKADGAQ